MLMSIKCFSSMMLLFFSVIFFAFVLNDIITDKIYRDIMMVEGFIFLSFSILILLFYPTEKNHIDYYRFNERSWEIETY